MSTYTAAQAAEDAREFRRQGMSLNELWRHVVLQLFDVYESRLRRSGRTSAISTFTAKPEPTGDPRVDAAIAALAEHLARRDDWKLPAWAMSQERFTEEWWFVIELPGMHPWSLRESPLSFRRRGIFISADGLGRV